MRKTNNKITVKTRPIMAIYIPTRASITIKSTKNAACEYLILKFYGVKMATLSSSTKQQTILLKRDSSFGEKSRKGAHKYKHPSLVGRTGFEKMNSFRYHFCFA